MWNGKKWAAKKADTQNEMKKAKLIYRKIKIFFKKSIASASINSNFQCFKQK